MLVYRNLNQSGLDVTQQHSFYYICLVLAARQDRAYLLWGRRFGITYSIQLPQLGKRYCTCQSTLPIIIKLVGFISALNKWEENKGKEKAPTCDAFTVAVCQTRCYYLWWDIFLLSKKTGNQSWIFPGWFPKEHAPARGAIAGFEMSVLSLHLRRSPSKRPSLCIVEMGWQVARCLHSCLECAVPGLFL